MLRVIFLSSFIALTTLCSGQVMSFGVLRIGASTVDSLRTYFGEISTPLPGSIKFQSKHKGLVECTVESFERPDLEFPTLYIATAKKYVPGYRIFHLDIYKIEKVELSDIELIFKDDVLISFKCGERPLNIEEILTYKYGEPTPNTVVRKTECGEESVYHSQKWAVSGHLAETTLYRFFGSDCDKILGSTFSMSNTIAHLDYLNLVEANKTKLERDFKAEKEKDFSKY